MRRVARRRPRPPKVRRPPASSSAGWLQGGAPPPPPPQPAAAPAQPQRRRASPHQSSPKVAAQALFSRGRSNVARRVVPASPTRRRSPPHRSSSPLRQQALSSSPPPPPPGPPPPRGSPPQRRRLSPRQQQQQRRRAAAPQMQHLPRSLIEEDFKAQLGVLQLEMREMELKRRVEIEKLQRECQQLRVAEKKKDAARAQERGVAKQRMAKLHDKLVRAAAHELEREKRTTEITLQAEALNGKQVRALHAEEHRRALAVRDEAQRVLESEMARRDAAAVLELDSMRERCDGLVAGARVARAELLDAHAELAKQRAFIVQLESEVDRRIEATVRERVVQIGAERERNAAAAAWHVNAAAASRSAWQAEVKAQADAEAQLQATQAGARERVAEAQARVAQAQAQFQQQAQVDEVPANVPPPAPLPAAIAVADDIRALMRNIRRAAPTAVDDWVASSPPPRCGVGDDRAATWATVSNLY